MYQNYITLSVDLIIPYLMETRRVVSEIKRPDLRARPSPYARVLCEGSKHSGCACECNKYFVHVHGFFLHDKNKFERKTDQCTACLVRIKYDIRDLRHLR